MCTTTASLHSLSSKDLPSFLSALDELPDLLPVTHLLQKHWPNWHGVAHHFLILVGGLSDPALWSLHNFLWSIKTSWQSEPHFIGNRLAKVTQLRTCSWLAQSSALSYTLVFRYVYVWPTQCKQSGCRITQKSGVRSFMHPQLQTTPGFTLCVLIIFQANGKKPIQSLLWAL